MGARWGAPRKREPERPNARAMLIYLRGNVTWERAVELAAQRRRETD